MWMSRTNGTSTSANARLINICSIARSPNWKVAWHATDIHDQSAGDGTDTIKLDPAAPAHVGAGDDQSSRQRGMFQVRFELSDASGQMLPSSFLTRFTVIHNVPGMTNRDDSARGEKNVFRIYGARGDDRRRRHPRKPQLE